MKRIVLALLLASQTSLAETDERTGLEIAPGWEQVRAHCGGCHSYALVTSQRANRGTWLGIIRWMQDTQNLWQFEPEVEKQILDYLAANYAPRRTYRRAPLPEHLMPLPAGNGG